MRRGEFLALQWCDIDLDRATLRVERSVEETRRGLRVKPPKTKRGRRNIALPPETVAMLRDHGKKQIERRLARAGRSTCARVLDGRRRVAVVGQSQPRLGRRLLALPRAAAYPYEPVACCRRAGMRMSRL